MIAYSLDLRARVLAACDDGMGTAEAAETFASLPHLPLKNVPLDSQAERVPVAGFPVELETVTPNNGIVEELDLILAVKNEVVSVARDGIGTDAV